MIFEKVNFTGLPSKFKKLYLLNYKEGNTSIFEFKNKFDYSTQSKFELEGELYVNNIINDDIIILWDLINKQLIIPNVDFSKLSIVSDHQIPAYRWPLDIEMLYDTVNKENSIRSNKVELYKFKTTFPEMRKGFKSGILIYQKKEDTDNWIKCLQLTSGNEKWKRSFEGKLRNIVIVEQHLVIKYIEFTNYIIRPNGEKVIDQYRPRCTTMVIDGETGQQLWHLPFCHYKVDEDRKKILALKREDENICNVELYIEVDIITGEINDEVKIYKPFIDSFNIMFADDKSVYYKYNGSRNFGRLNKTSGKIDWEFELVDDQGAKRKINNFLVLGNGNLVLQPYPNHPNGDFTCVFNADENMEYSIVKDGVRIE